MRELPHTGLFTRCTRFGACAVAITSLEKNFVVAPLILKQT
jgi:hypothetical protein